MRTDFTLSSRTRHGLSFKDSAAVNSSHASSENGTQILARVFFAVRNAKKQQIGRRSMKWLIVAFLGGQL
jgi:hypothetical protein